MPTEVEVPKGLTLIDPNQAPSGTDASGVKVPKGLTLIGGQQPQSTPKFGPPPQAEKPDMSRANQPFSAADDAKFHKKSTPQDLKSPIPSGLTLIPKEDSHIDTFMAGIRKPAALRQQVYDYTVGSGYTADQARQRQNEYDYAIKNGINPERAQEFALGMQFEGGTPKYNLTDAEKTALYDKAKQAAEQFKSGQQKTIESHFLGESLLAPPSEDGYREKIDPDEYARNYVKGYAYARSQGWDEAKAQEYATSDAASQWMTRAGEWIDPKWHSVKSAILNVLPGVSKPEERAENPFFATNQGYRENQFHVYHEASWLDEHVGKVAGSVDAGLGNVVNGFATPGMAALMVASEGQGLLAKGGLGVAEEAETANLATRALGRVARFGGRQLGRAAAASEQIDSAEALEVAGRAEKAVQAIRDARLPVSAQKVARTFNKLVTVGFTAQMAQGGAEQLGQAYKTAFPDKGEGDSALAVEYAVEGLVSAAMAVQGGNHLREEHLLTQALNDKTSEMYGPQKLPTSVTGPYQKAATKFGDLDPYRQAAVITRLIEDDPKYKAAEDASEKEKKRLAKKTAYRYNTALRQAWNPDAVKRMVRVIDTHNAVNEQRSQQQKTEDDARKHYLDQIAKLIDQHKANKADEAELEAAEEERRAAGREGRPVRKTEAAQKREESRKVTLTTAGQIAEAREGVTAAREDADRETALQETEAAEKATATPQKEWDDRYARVYGMHARNNPDWSIPRLHGETLDIVGERPEEDKQGELRYPDEVTDDQGYVSYRGRAFGGEDHFFGPTMREVPQGPGLPPKQEWGVYRKTPDGMEYLGAGGIFEAHPEQPFIAADKATTRTLAQITSLRVNADYALEEHGSTPEREAQRSELRNLERQLVDGEVTAEQARKTARLPEEAAEKPPKAQVDQEIAAARAGALNGPLHGRTRAQYEDDFLAGLEEAGWPSEDIEAVIDTMGVNLRMEAENNLHYVGKSGDWIKSKKGVIWRLDADGMLQADGWQGAPIPLMKNGRYTAQAIDLAMSGVVGFGRRPLEVERVEVAKEHEATQMLDNLSQAEKDELERSIRLSKQNEGLLLETGELPAKKPAPNRKKGFAPPAMHSDVEEDHTTSQEVYDSTIESIGGALENPLSHETARGIIGRVAKNSGLTPQEVIRIQRERMVKPDTLEGKIEWLRVGDTISNKGGIPWVLETDSKGNLYLENRAGKGIKIPFDRGNPSDDVRRIVGNGEVQSTQRTQYTPADIRRAAYEAPYITQQLGAIEEVKARAAGDVRDPEPRTPEQAEHQAQAAQVRADEVKGAAIVETVKASDPAPGTSLPEAEAAVDKAEEGVQTAEQAAWQGIEAKAKTVSDKPFPPRAPITMGPQYTGFAGTIKHLGQSYNFHYALVPDDQVVNSHVWDGNVLGPNPEYDEDLQPRTISEARSSELVLEAQIRQSDSAKGFDFDYFGDKTISPLTGPPILEQGGRNAGGNTRLAILRKHLEIIKAIADPEERDAAMAGFRSRMAQLAREVGIGGQIPMNGRDYLVVRMLDDPITTRRDAATKGLVFNTSPSHDIGEAARGVALAKQLSDGTLEDIGRMLDEHDTLGAAIAANPKVFTEIIRNELGVPSTEERQWLNEKTKTLSENGRRRFAQVLMGRVLEDTSVMEALEGTPSLTSIERAVINIVRMKATKNAPVVDKIVEAIHAAKTTWDTGIAGEGIADRWQATYDPKATTFDFAAFEVPPMPDKVVESIWRAIHAGPRTLSDRVKAYNETDRPSQGGMLSFEGEKQKLETPVELFNRVFAKELKEVNYNREGKRGDGITEAEYNAAMENRGNLSDKVVEEAKRTEKGQPAEKRRPETAALRKRIDQMSDAEKTQALLTSRKTALPNMTDFEEHNDPKLGGTPAPAIGMSDVDGLKAFNDKYGYAAGDKLLRAKADALRAVGVEAYHDKGDEFVYRAQNPGELKAKLDQARQILRDTPIEVTKNGKTETFRGVDFSFGIGNDLDEAKEGQNTAKAERTAAGERKRGEFGNIKAAPEQADTTIAAAKAEKGYVTPDELQTFLESHPATEAHASEYMRTAQIMAQSFWDIKNPEGVYRKHALEWVLKESGLRGVERGDSEDVKGEYDPVTHILKLHEAADETTFMHEFAHVISPMLSDADWKAIDTIKVDKTAYKRQWGKEWKYSGKSERQEKLAYGLEQFLRDENPTNFHLGYEARGVLEKIKEMFVSVYQKLLPGDPLSPFKLSEEAREFFSRTLGIEGMDLRDDWNEKVKAARKEEIKQKKGIVLPIPELTKKIKDFGPSPTHVQRYMDADVDSQEGRVDVSKTKRLVAVQYADEADAVHAFINAQEKGVGVQLLRGKNGEWAIQFNTEEDVPDSVLYQEVPKPKQEGLRLEDLEAKLKTTTSPILKKFLETQIGKLKAEIRNEPRPQAEPGLAKQAIAEVKRGTEGRTVEQGRERVSDLRGVPDGATRVGDKTGVGRLSRPPVMGMPGHAGAGGAGNRGGTGGGERPVDLATVAPVNVVPMPERTAAPVGTLAGDNFDPKAWDEACQKAGLPRLPYPTKVLSRQVAQILGKYGGEIQSAQTLLTALSNGDGAVLASVPGSGKTWVLSGVVQETLLNNPDAKILFITKNRKLLKDAARVMSDGYGLEMETDHLKGDVDRSIYGATYARLRSNELYKKTQWDLVIADESGEARNWHQPQKEVKAGEKPKVHQGILLKQVMDNAKKGIYSSATPFLSPMDYGYLDKLNLWPKGEFDEWVKNFKHETVGGKTVSQLDPVKQAKMRQQLIERGQFISQKISYDGYTIHFGVVPVTDLVERKLDRIHQGIAVMRRELLKQGKKGLSEKVAAFEATYTKAFLDRSRADEIIQLAKQGREQGWRVAVMSETTSEDLFRKPIEEGGKMGTYRQLDEDTGGQISHIMPEFGNMADTLRAEFGDEIGDYSGIGNTDAQRETALEDFSNGKKPMLYMSYASGGIGVNPQDKIGDKPTLVIYTGPPYSGYLLDQALGRFWRFDTKSNVHAIILATDAEPDVRMMATKIAPRMEALGAAVNGHRDSLASVMANYTDEEKMREHQDMLAFDQGNEVKVDAQGYQVRSKRKVSFDNWSAIKIPNAEEAKNKGMKTEGFGGGKGSDWATLYQEKPRRWEPPNRPLTMEDLKVRRAVNAAAEKAAQNPQIPTGEIAMAATRADEIANAAPEGVDKEAAARDAVGGHLKGIGYVQDPITGEWKTPEQIKAAKPTGEPEEKYTAGWGMMSSQEQNLINLDRQMNTGGAGRELVTKTRRYSAMIQRELADRRTDFTKIMQDNHLNPQDDKVMRDLFDVVMGKRAVADPAINKAAGEVSKMMARIHQKGAAGELKVRTPDGRLIPWGDFQDDPSYMPRIADWNAKFTDGEKTYTLKEIMGGTFGELKAKELLAKKLKEEGSTMTADRAYDLIKRERLKAPVQGNIQRTNETNFPFIRKDYGALDNYFKQFAKAMATESEFGSDLGKLKREINKLPNKQARTDVEAMFGYMFTPQNWDTDLGRVYNTAAAMETATKMTFSAAKVLFHSFNAPMVMGGKVMPIVKALGHMAGDWKKTRENGYYIGTVMHGIDPAVMYMPETKTQHALFKYTGFEYLYNLGRSIAGESARVYLDQYAMDDLKKGGHAEATARRLLKNTFLIGDHAIDVAKQTGKWDPEDYKLAQVAFTNESLYGDSPLQMPGLARRRIAGEGLDTAQKRINMALRASYSLQSFSVKTYSMLREHLWDEVMVHHNLKPLAYAMVVAPVIGQLLQGASAGVKGGTHRLAQFGLGRPHTEDAWDKWLAQFTDLKDKNATAWLKLYIDGICSQWALERTKRFADAFFNLAIGSKDSEKSAAATGRYLLNDEVEQDIGPIWTDTVMKPIEFTGEEIEAGAGKPGTFIPRTEKNIVRHAEELTPLLRQEPHVEEFVSPKKSTGKWAVP